MLIGGVVYYFVHAGGSAGAGAGASATPSDGGDSTGAGVNPPPTITGNGSNLPKPTNGYDGSLYDTGDTGLPIRKQIQEGT